MNKPIILWAHPRSASSELLNTYANNFNLRVNLEEPIKQGSAKLEDLLKLKISFKIMGSHATQEIIDQTINANYDHIILFRKDIYRAYLSFAFSKLTGVWNVYQLITKSITGCDIISAMSTSDVYAEPLITIKQVKRFYKDLNRVYLHLDKNSVQYQLIETKQAIDYIGLTGYQNTDYQYYKLENAQAKEELESFIQTLEIYKNHDMQSTI